VVRTALILGEGPVLSLKPMPSLVSELTARESVRRLESDDLSLRDIERCAILEALRRTQRNQAKAARMLGITDRTLREKLRRYSQEDQPLALTGENRW
jgi:DNA-binding NtrC family response regulator